MAIAVCGGKRAEGELRIQGSKNAVLPMMAAALLSGESCVIENCPDITDVHAMAEVARETGAAVAFEGNRITLNGFSIHSGEILGQKAGEIRASVLLLGVLLSRTGKVRMDYPGGCSIGSRPVDYHLQAFRQMGAEVCEMDDGIHCQNPGRLHGAAIKLPFPSVGATENILLAAVLAEGTTWIQNAAREPEIVELCGFLEQMGAEINGAGTKHIVVRGKERLHGVTWTLGADRIAFLTYAMMTAGCGGDCFFELGDTAPAKETAILARLGCELSFGNRGVRVRQNGRPKPIASICTGPYPAFPTDGQSLLMAVLTKSSGISLIEEGVFDNRFRMIHQLHNLGANIDFVSNHACITGVTKLHGARVRADDLRSGAGLLIAGAMADGETVVSNDHFIRRGYEDIVGRMREISLEAAWVSE